MGFLDEGRPLLWQDSKRWLAYIRLHGVLQFLETFKRVSERKNDVLLWGDEVEYHMVHFDDKARTVRIYNEGTAVLKQMNTIEEELGKDKSYCTWHPEYGEWMIEATPRLPFGSFVTDLLKVQKSMEYRRQRLNTVLLQRGVAALSCVAFPLLGVGKFTYADMPPGGEHAQSEYISDKIINHHPRFSTLTANIRTRRGERVDIRAPLFIDERTELADVGSDTFLARRKAERDREDEAGMLARGGAGSTRSVSSESTGGGMLFGMDLGDEAGGRAVALPAKQSGDVSGLSSAASYNHVQASEAELTPVERRARLGPVVHMDAMAFGMGMCCLQVTFQARDLSESRYLYDQLAILCPIMSALSAACPILRGRLVDTDVRWATIAGSVDDRTPQERGKEDVSASSSASAAAADEEEEEEEEGKEEHEQRKWSSRPMRIRKSRYDGVDLFMSERPRMKAEKYNDNSLEMHQATYDRLVKEGIDDRLARHIAHLFIRDPLVIYREKIEIDDEKHTDHFENIQSTNWQTMRWKPPPPPPHPVEGWRVEFRSMEAQWSDFEGAAYTVLVVLLSRVVLFFDLNMYIPISKVDENMRTAHARGAAVRGKFWFRKHVVPLSEQCDDDATRTSSKGDDGTDTENDMDGEGEDAYELMTCEEILMGKGADFPGLIALIYAYLDIIGCSGQTRKVIDAYVELICRRASGKTPTTAEWVRRFVAQHKAYEGDSVVNDEIAYDLLSACRELAARNEVPGTTPRSYIPAAGASKADTEAELDGNAIFAGLKGAARTELRRFSSSNMSGSHSPTRKGRKPGSVLGKFPHGNGTAAAAAAAAARSAAEGEEGVVVRTERGTGLAEERAILSAATAGVAASDVEAIEKQADKEGEAAAAQFAANEATMRGSSFVKEVQASQCSLVRRLLDKYRGVAKSGTGWAGEGEGKQIEVAASAKPHVVGGKDGVSFGDAKAFFG